MLISKVRRLLLACGAFVAFAAPAALAVGSFDIVIDPGSGMSSNQAALDAFNRAAATWESHFSDPITITIHADLGTFSNPNIIGSTSSVGLQSDYNTIAGAMVADAADEPSNAIVASLPDSPTFNLKMGTTYSGNISLTKANAKALGFTGLDETFGVFDATITFNQAFTFDYDSSNGITPGTTDFQTVATHEIGHALGFSSVVDAADPTVGALTLTPNTLDLFRFPADHIPTNAAQFSSYARELQPGVEAVTSDTVNNYGMSTGLTSPPGDGRQASHWKADEITGVYIGIMDPTLGTGVTEEPTDADYRAFDLIGYDLVVVPEPVTIFAGALCSLALLWRVRRRIAAA